MQLPHLALSFVVTSTILYHYASYTENARLLVDRFEETVRDPTWYGWSRRVLAVEICLTEVETIMPADLAHHMRQSFLDARNSKQYNELVKWRPIQSPGRMVYTWGYYVDIVSEKPDY